MVFIYKGINLLYERKDCNMFRDPLTKKRSLIFYCLIGIILLVVGCGTDTSVEVKAKNFEYIPNEISIPKGEEGHEGMIGRLIVEDK
jgi:hypothetical protein